MHHKSHCGLALLALAVLILSYIVQDAALGAILFIGALAAIIIFGIGICRRTRINPWLCILILPLLAGGPGCTTTGEFDTVRVARVAREAAQFGTSEALRGHPEWRQKFVDAQLELKFLQTSPTLGIADLLRVINRLPVNELKSDEARIAITGARILIAGLNLPEVSAERLAQLQPIAGAISEGIGAGLLAP